MGWNDCYVDISVLNGQTISEVRGLVKGSDEVFIETLEGNSYQMYHRQGCYETVSIEDIDGDDSDLIGGVVLSAEEITGETPSDYDWGGYVPESYTWTFYKINTSKGGVFIRWLGSSNGYYSESIDFIDLNKRGY